MLSKLPCFFSPLSLITFDGWISVASLGTCSLSWCKRICKNEWATKTCGVPQWIDFISPKPMVWWYAWVCLPKTWRSWTCDCRDICTHSLIALFPILWLMTEELAFSPRMPSEPVADTTRKSLRTLPRFWDNPFCWERPTTNPKYTWTSALAHQHAWPQSEGIWPAVATMEKEPDL